MISGDCVVVFGEDEVLLFVANNGDVEYVDLLVACSCSSCASMAAIFFMNSSSCHVSNCSTTCFLGCLFCCKSFFYLMLLDFMLLEFNLEIIKPLVALLGLRISRHG